MRLHHHILQREITFLTMQNLLRSSTEPEMCSSAVSYHENTEIEKIVIIVCTGKSSLTYSTKEASVVRFGLEK